jgi:hypothetical protein
VHPSTSGWRRLTFERIRVAQDPARHENNMSGTPDLC